MRYKITIAKPLKKSFLRNLSPTTIGEQESHDIHWIPAFAGMTIKLHLRIAMIAAFLTLPVAVHAQLGGQQQGGISVERPATEGITVKPPKAVTPGAPTVPGAATVDKKVGIVPTPTPPEDMLPVGRRGNCGDLGGPKGTLERIVVRSGNDTYTTCFGWDDAGNPKAVIDPGGYLTEFTYDLIDRPVRIVDPLREQQDFEYNPNSQLWHLTGSNKYNPNGDPDARTLEFGYDIIGNILSRRILGGDDTETRYTPDDEVKGVFGPGQPGVTTDYDGAGRVETVGVAQLDEDGNVAAEEISPVRYGYDDAGRLERMTDGEGRETRFGYDTFGRMNLITYPDRSSIYYRYDNGNRLVYSHVRETNGGVIKIVEWQYDSMDRVTEIKTGKPGENAVWRTNYVYENGGATVNTSSYLGDHLIASSTTHYDSLGRLTSTEVPTAGSANYIYGDGGQMERIEHSANGLLSRFGFDALGRIEYVRDALGNLTSYLYNGFGNLARAFPAGGDPTAFKYDKNGRLMETDTGANREGVIVNPDKINFRYDGAGRLEQTIFSQPAGAEYPGAISRFSNVTDLLELTDAPDGAELSRVVERNRAGQTKKWTDPNGTEFTVQYDSAGRPNLTMAMKAGSPILFRYTAYDALGRPTVIAESKDAHPLSFTEVKTGTSSAASALMKKLFGGKPYDDRLLSVIRYKYDAMGNITEEKRWVEGRWLTSTAGFGPANDGMMITTNYPSGFKAEQTIDRAGRTGKVRGLDGRSVAADATYQYQPNGPRLTEARFGPHLTTERYTYDAAGRTTGISVFKTPAGGRESELASATYKYSPAGQIIAKTESVTPAVNQKVMKGFTTGYDGMNRVIWWSSVGADISDQVVNNSASAPENGSAVRRYGYDARGVTTSISTRDENGGLTGRRSTGDLYSYTHRWDGTAETARYRPCWAEQDGLLGGCDPARREAEISFDPDDNGNIQSEETAGAAGRIYEYDLFGRLIKVTDAVNRREIFYSYDGRGRLISRKVLTNRRETEWFQYAWAGSYLLEQYKITAVSALGNVTAIITSYVYGSGPGDLIASYDRRWTFYHHNHPDGSPLLITDRGNISQWFRYSPEGSVRVLNWSGGREQEVVITNANTNRLFGGALVEPHTGFYFAGAWYDPRHGFVM